MPKRILPPLRQEALPRSSANTSKIEPRISLLFPPLTYLQPTGRTDRVDAVDRDGNPIAFTVVEVTPFF
jgi:hypothetical protein